MLEQKIFTATFSAESLVLFAYVYIGFKEVDPHFLWIGSVEAGSIDDKKEVIELLVVCLNE